MSKLIERCWECDELTGRAGRSEDSLYIGEHGPLCETCFKEMACTSCGGDGEVWVRRNARGEVDYLNGAETGERADCDTCSGTGLVS